QVVEPDAARDDVAARRRQVEQTVARAQEGFDLFRFDEGDVLSGLVGASEIPVVFDAFTRDDTDARLFCLRLATVGSDVDSLDVHRGSDSGELEYQSSTRSARSVFHRLGRPSPSS